MRWSRRCVPQRERTDELGFTHLTYQQVLPVAGTVNSETHEGPLEATRRGIEVYGSKLAAHFAPGSRLVEVQSSCQVDLTPANKITVSSADLRTAVRSAIAKAPRFRELQARAKQREETLFPLLQEPRIVLYPWLGKLIYAYATYGYHLLPEDVRPPNAAGGDHDEIAFGQMFFDAESGELFLFAPTRKDAETADVGSGKSSIPLGGPFDTRTLQIVRVDSTSTYRLRNTTKSRNIVTFDANANSAWVYPDIPSLIEAGTIPVSNDTDGDKKWDRTAASTSDADRTSSQQPEVDEHATAAELYDFYAAIGNRVGWDDGQYSAPLVPHQDINVVAHTYDDGALTSRSVNAFFDQELVSGHWVSHLAFFDGDPTGATGQTDDPSHPVWKFDYLAGSKAIVGHEYQHAVTDFSFVDGAGNPGLTYSDWLAAVHEGTSDVFGGLFSGQWWMGTDISPTGRIFRNLAFPRDTAAADPSKFDHFDDRNNITGSGARYFRGDILAHAAYLMAQGGIHQRASRTPALIPVKGLGNETLSGLDVYKAARIIYRAYTHYLSNIGASTGLPANDENVFRTIRNGCVSAAIDLYGAGSSEHKTTVLAWYAVGLQPTATAVRRRRHVRHLGRRLVDVAPVRRAVEPRLVLPRPLHQQRRHVRVERADQRHRQRHADRLREQGVLPGAQRRHRQRPQRPGQLRVHQGHLRGRDLAADDGQGRQHPDTQPRRPGGRRDELRRLGAGHPAGVGDGEVVDSAAGIRRDR